MYIVTFREFDFKTEKFIQGHRIYERIDEVNDFIEFAMEDVDMMKDLEVWEAEKVKLKITVDVEVEVDKS